MNTNPQRREWFFPIEEAPVLVAVTHKGVARDVRVPHKKALIAADTGDILGIVGAGYKVFTNQQAVTLCHKFCLEAFPDTTPAEWMFVEDVPGPVVDVHLAHPGVLHHQIERPLE